eukprot:TRINITY_DN1043_c0_g1_i4.p2 TRINITY_DN1043_c0_g1~~TRINITY_DN1043_c0_g1_i4.p2  ORF type:complete len:232 (-),score=85.44 TRINITY_DN1043_c0_g1_i4:758-1453(-)
MPAARTLLAAALSLAFASVVQADIVKCSAYADATSDCMLGGAQVISALKTMTDTTANPSWTGYCDRVYIRSLDSIEGGRCGATGVTIKKGLFVSGTDTLVTVVPTATEVVLCQTQQLKVNRVKKEAFSIGIPRPIHRVAIVNQLDQFTSLDDGAFDNVVTDILDLRGNVYMTTAAAWNPQAFSGADVRNRTIIPTTADASRCPLALIAANGHWETWHMDYDPLDMYSGGLC